MIRNDSPKVKLRELALCRTMVLTLSEFVFESNHISHELCFRET
jgi:hypothetical protein